MTERNIDQSGQNIAGSQINAGGDVNIDHLGNKVDTGGGDYVARDKIIKQYIETKTIACGNSDGTVRVWPAPERLAELACRQVSRARLTKAEWKLYVGDVMPWREEGQCDLEAGLPVWWEEVQ